MKKHIRYALAAPFLIAAVVFVCVCGVFCAIGEIIAGDDVDTVDETYGLED